MRESFLKTMNGSFVSTLLRITREETPWNKGTVLLFLFLRIDCGFQVAEDKFIQLTVHHGIYIAHLH